MNYFLKFDIEDIEFAVPINEISEIARPKELIKKSETNKYFAGYFLLRNKKVPTFDLPEFLGMKRSENFEIIVLTIKDTNYGIKVNKVSGITKTKKGIAPYPQIARPKKYLHGLITEENNVVQVLSLANLLGGSRLKALRKQL